jgi:hypothetical protein
MCNHGGGNQPLAHDQALQQLCRLPLILQGRKLPQKVAIQRAAQTRWRKQHQMAHGLRHLACQG